MSVSEAEFEILATALAAAPPASATSLRAALGGLPVIVLAAEDLADETPYRVLSGYAVHLMDGSSHCPSLTADPVSATGLILARQS